MADSEPLRDGGRSRAQSEDERRWKILDGLPTPVPCGGVEAFAEEREAALAASPACRANFERYRANPYAVEVDYLPLRLDFENVSRCNFHCVMCTVSDWPHGRRARDLSLEEFKRILDDQPGLLEIKVQGIGEPVMQGDPYFEMISHARARRIWVRTTTNASLLHLRDNARKLVDSGANEIQISVDGADRETFEAIRRGSVFSRVSANCRLINDYCRSLGVERTKMWTVVQSRNVDQLEALVDVAANLGFTTQVFALNVGSWAVESWEGVARELSVFDELDVDRLPPLVERGRARGVNVAFWVVRDRYRLGNPKTLCPWLFSRAFVSSDSRVVPCCIIGNPDTYQIDGEIGEERTLSDIWKGRAYVDFRRAHVEGNLPAVCRNCYHLPS